jgi:hypothetical protein
MANLLYLHNRKIETVFQLLGEHENDISYSFAWALAQCPSFLSTFLNATIDYKKQTPDVLVRLQHHEAAGGFTDIEIELPGCFYIIVEAKRGWNLPSHRQLDLYANRHSFAASQSPLKRLLVLSECSHDYAEVHLEVRKSAGIPIHPISWRDIARLADKARATGSHREKHLLDEFLVYIGGLMTMQNTDSNWVYVVALAYGKRKYWQISWVDIVKKRRRYFHPVGGGPGGWPKEPPNYIAFRYHGKLQSIHHIEGYEVFTNPHLKFPEIPETDWDPHFLYKLGPAFGPEKEVRTGNIFRSGRVWCMIDTLFICDTISAARDLSKKRERQKT